VARGLNVMSNQLREAVETHYPLRVVELVPRSEQLLRMYGELTCTKGERYFLKSYPAKEFSLESLSILQTINGRMITQGIRTPSPLTDKQWAARVQGG